jgi:uracil-DNA glycosylase family protein
MSSDNVPVMDIMPERGSLPALRDAAEGCRGCDLYKNATQTVFGEGTRNAEVVLVGEQPGDREDIQGKPFVGPAGRLLDKAFGEAGLDRSKVYITNVVKHFKWVERGKRRIHKKPSMGEIAACRPWLDAELAAIKPRAVVALGATAAQALLGKDFRVSKARGEFVSSELAPLVMATVHPSSILRGPEEEREQNLKAFVADLSVLADRLEDSE